MKFCFGQVKTEMPVGHLSQYIFMCKAHGMQGELHTCCCCSVTKSCLILWIPWAAACQASLFSTISQNLLKFMSVEWVILYNHLILCYPLLLLLSVFPRWFKRYRIHLQRRRLRFDPLVRMIPCSKGMVTHSSILVWKI